MPSMCAFPISFFQSSAEIFMIPWMWNLCRRTAGNGRNTPPNPPVHLGSTLPPHYLNLLLWTWKPEREVGWTKEWMWRFGVSLKQRMDQLSWPIPRASLSVWIHFHGHHNKNWLLCQIEFRVGDTRVWEGTPIIYQASGYCLRPFNPNFRPEPGNYRNPRWRGT